MFGKIKEKLIDFKASIIDEIEDTGGMKAGNEKGIYEAFPF